MPRFFVPPHQIHDNIFVITGSEAEHAVRVLRKKPGDAIELFDGENMAFEGRIESVSKNRIEGIIIERSNPSVLPFTLTLYQALIKGPKWDWLVEKACEVGVSHLVPVITARTVVQAVEGDRQAHKMDRWRNIALAAAKQCGRNNHMTISEPLILGKALQNLPNNSLTLIPWEKTTTVTIRQACNTGKKRHIGIFIGPEGGWEENEVEQAMKKGAIPVTLGPTLLRAETAGLVACVLTAAEYLE